MNRGGGGGNQMKKKRKRENINVEEMLRKQHQVILW